MLMGSSFGERRKIAGLSVACRGDGTPRARRRMRPCASFPPMQSSATLHRRSHWGLVTLNGVLLLLAGLFLAIFPFAGALSFTAAVGIYLVAVGAMGLFVALKALIQPALLLKVAAPEDGRTPFSADGHRSGLGIFYVRRR